MRNNRTNQVPVQPGGGNPGPFFVEIQDLDIVEDQSKVTTGLFTGNVGTLQGTNFVTESTSAEQKKYYYNLQYSNATQLSVAFGHLGGSGSTGTNGSLTKLKGETEAVYRQFASHVMDDDLIKNGFVFDSGSDGTTILAQNRDTAGVTGSIAQSDGQRGEPGMYFIQAARSRMKDRVNAGTWTLNLSGSTSAPFWSGSSGAVHNSASMAGMTFESWGSGSTVTSASVLHLTDDSDYTDGGATSTIAGPRYNIISGSAGKRVSKTPVYGWFYPNLGLWALRESMLSSSIPGHPNHVTSSTDEMLGYADVFGRRNSRANGLAMDTRISGDADNAAKLVKAMRGTQTFRAEEDQTTTSYFCRARANQFNATNNVTWLSGSNGRLTNLSMEGNPTTFIGTIGLYDSNHNLVAVGRLSSPISKNFKKEATIKVNLTF